MFEFNPPIWYAHAATINTVRNQNFLRELEHSLGIQCRLLSSDLIPVKAMVSSKWIPELPCHGVVIFVPSDIPTRSQHIDYVISQAKCPRGNFFRPVPVLFIGLVNPQGQDYGRTPITVDAPRDFYHFIKHDPATDWDEAVRLFESFVVNYQLAERTEEEQMRVTTEDIPVPV